MDGFAAGEVELDDDGVEADVDDDAEEELEPDAADAAAGSLAGSLPDESDDPVGRESFR